MSSQSHTSDVLAPVAGEIGLSDHAAHRWDERTPADSVAPETAWRRAFEMSLPRSEYRNVDELRYYRPQGVVLLRGGASLVTVLSVDDPDADAVLVEQVRKQFGGSQS